ncbi:MAG: AraC family transcriptional regulator [Defluviitaleaceae bacterium]|nr:AraC family transcriptional regulator [Defluviitaleaceae bacterium]
MNILNRLNSVVDYVERNITEEIDLNHLAGIACCSTYNFQRMFAFITEVSIVEYIRRRRLTLATFELQHSNVKIIDLASKYGYDSPISFTRAFKALHGITPSEARELNTPLKAFSRMTFQITIKGVSVLNYRIVKTEALRVFGLEGIISTIGDKKYFPNPDSLWNENFQNGKFDRLYSDIGEVKSHFYNKMFIRNDMDRIHAMLNYNEIDATTHGYMQFGFITSESKTDNYKVVEIPASTWVIFTSDPIDDCCDSEKTWTELYKRFYNEWLPTSEFEKANSPDLEMFGGTPGQRYAELWMPIIKKKGDQL